jgi:DNA helicase-4
VGRFFQNLVRRSEKVQFAAIELVSIRRSYQERKDKGTLRKLVKNEDKFHLSEMQIKAAASRARETLVVAGAGSGKTSLILGRAIWLIRSKRVAAEKVLILAFNRAAAKEIEERLRAVDTEVKAMTFHAYGKEVLALKGEKKKLFYTESHQSEKLIRDLFEKGLTEDQKNQLVHYFGYQQVPFRDVLAFKNLDEYKTYVNGNIPQTYQGEKVKSHGEWAIANFLYRYSIDYEYEAPYEHGGENWHRPDFTIKWNGKKVYLEYFGIDANRNTAPWINRKEYLDSIEWKRSVHETMGTELISLTYQDMKDGKLLIKLAKILEARGVKGRAKNPDELLMAANAAGYKREFLELCGLFLGHVRAKRLDIPTLLGRAEGNTRSTAFVNLFEIVLNKYLTTLEEKNAMDFTDLIHLASDYIEKSGTPSEISHLLVDEYQDISSDRDRLIKAIEKSNSSLGITCVGDDWQSIYQFAGSDIRIMSDAARVKRDRKRVDLEETFRLPQVIADLSREFILENPKQLSKKVISRVENQPNAGVFIHWNTDINRTNENIRQVIEYLGEEANQPNRSLMILTRYKSNFPNLRIIEKYWEGPLSIGTIHSSKGLEADYVIVADLYADTRGFPSVIQDDPVLELIFGKEDEAGINYAEERRLFYVATTRSMISTHLVCPNDKPSIFGLELLNKEFGTHIGAELRDKSCPVCGHESLILSNATGGTYCRNRPICEFLAPKCECGYRMIYTGNSQRRFYCASHPDIDLQDCPKCDWGIMMTRTNSFTGETFTICHAKNYAHKKPIVKKHHTHMSN